MNIRINKITRTFLICSVLLFVACKKDHSVLDTGTQPGNDELNAEQLTDLPVTAHSIFADSIASFKERYKFLGSNNDPVFGKTDVGLYANMSLNVTNQSFPTATLISSEIALAYDASNYIGDPAAKLTCSVYPINQTLDPTAIYYSSNNRMHETNPIFVTVATTTTAANGQAMLKIDFDKTYISNLMADTANLKSNDIFQAKYKGFYIAASVTGGDGLIYKLDLENDLSGFYIYYKDATDTMTSFRYPFSGANTTKYNTIKYTPAQDLVNVVQDSMQGANRLFLKGFGHTKLKVQIPFLKNMSDSFYISVNRAEVILYEDPAVTSSSGVYEKPPVLSLLLIDSLGKERFTEDHRTSTTFSKYGGTYDSENKRYVFNIASEVQAILSGKKKNRGFYLVVAQSAVGLKEIYAADNSKELLSLRRDNYAERVVLAGYGNVTLKPRLNLSFVKLRNEIR